VLDSVRDLGFEAIGFTAFADHREEKNAVKAWIEKDYHASMGYMEKRISSYGRPGMLFPGSVGAVMVIFRWSRILTGADQPWNPWVASFARGPDYHGLVKDRLRKLEKRIGTSSIASFVDSSPFCERGLAMRAGLGWIGRNRYLIHPDLGGGIGIGEIVVNRPFIIHQTVPTGFGQCGECRACIDACPTGALSEEGVDARRCLSFLTAELRSVVPRDLREHIGTRMFGCDECLIACPYSELTRIEPRDVPTDFPISVLSIESNRMFKAAFEDSPFYRLGRKATLRNAMIVLGNIKEVKAIDRLSVIARTDSSAMVREQAIWSLGRMCTRTTRTLMESLVDTAPSEMERETARYVIDLN